ncbi:RtcB family protein [Thiohalomonas denitrificans]|uniref:tRNA-splicing ligase RtcB n=1 Tax=Thiohalomonas denitrificans TaxID=415747 RepID=A0A1G5PSL5_9GAMM|nr:RtcB family protein [Thiohalomonas denitrificans]SCZ52462.1 tRNA-splicing ligase RtcB [Thiohalomonas denitrificans]
MAISGLERRSEHEWVIPQTGPMRVPAVIYASESLVNAMDAKVFEQACNVASLPGIVGASYAMPDAHWGYGFPIGGVAAFDPTAGGVISAGGVGFDISCGVRTLRTGMTRAQLEAGRERLANELFRTIPAGVGSTTSYRLTGREMDDMLAGGARWAVENGFGRPEDLLRVEEHGCMEGAEPSVVSQRAKERQRDEMGTLGSGNHYLEVQRVVNCYDPEAAAAFGLAEDDIVVSIHCGSRGLGHQIGTEFLREMVIAAPGLGIELPDRELACAPIESPLGQRYLGAMRAGINCALANRQILTQMTREVFARVFPEAQLELVYDVSHNTCKAEPHYVDGRSRGLFVHRKGATRAYGPGHPELPEEYRKAGQPVIIGGSMGTASYILAGTQESEQRAFSSACHGAGRAMSRHAATRQWQGRQVVDELAARGIIVKSRSLRGVAEEAPGAYKEVAGVVEATDRAGLARKVARLEPMIGIKG